MAGDKRDWIAGSGGPLILLPEELLETWEGIDTPRDKRIVKTKRRWSQEQPATDYDRACDVDALIANVDVGDGRAIILGGEPHLTTFEPRETGYWLVRWVEAETEAAIFDHLAQHPVDTSEGVPAMIDAQPGPLLLFDAACPGGELEEDKIVVNVHPGTYVVSAIEYRPGDDLSLVLIGFDKV